MDDIENKETYSICSRHQEPEPGCDLCAITTDSKEKTEKQFTKELLDYLSRSKAELKLPGTDINIRDSLRGKI